MFETDVEHPQWIHDRLINVYGENKDVDFLIRLRKIIKDYPLRMDTHYANGYSAGWNNALSKDGKAPHVLYENILLNK